MAKNKDKNLIFQFDRLSFNESYFWMVFTSNEDKAIAILETLPLSINAEIAIAHRSSVKIDFYTIWDAYNPSLKHGGKLNVSRMGTWNPENGLNIEFTQYKYHRRSDLHGMHLNFSVAVSLLLYFFIFVDSTTF